MSGRQFLGRLTRLRLRVLTAEDGLDYVSDERGGLLSYQEVEELVKQLMQEAK